MGRQTQARIPVKKVEFNAASTIDISAPAFHAKQGLRRGRPIGTTAFDADPAMAFGDTVRALWPEQGVAQEALAHLAGMGRSHMGKVERDEHMLTLALILKISRALNVGAGELMDMTEMRLQAAD